VSRIPPTYRPSRTPLTGANGSPQSLVNLGAWVPKRHGGGNGQPFSGRKQAYRPAYRAAGRGGARRGWTGAGARRACRRAAPVIIDAQVHAYAANTPERPWHSVPNWPAHVTGDEMVAAMDKVGVDGAIYISPFSMYQYDGSYAVSVQRAHPDKFALVKPVNPDDPAVADVIADWKKTPGTVFNADKISEPLSSRESCWTARSDWSRRVRNNGGPRRR